MPDDQTITTSALEGVYKMQAAMAAMTTMTIQGSAQTSDQPPKGSGLGIDRLSGGTDELLHNANDGTVAKEFGEDDLTSDDDMHDGTTSLTNSKVPTSTGIISAASAESSRLAVAAITNASMTSSAATMSRGAASLTPILVPGHEGILRLETEEEAKARRYRQRKRAEMTSIEDLFSEAVTLDNDRADVVVIDLYYPSTDDEEPSNPPPRAAVPPRNTFGLNGADIHGALKAAKALKDTQTKRSVGTHAISKVGQAASTRQLALRRIGKTQKPLSKGKASLPGASKYDKYKSRQRGDEDDDEDDE